MSRNRKIYNRNFTLLLYPDNKEHMKALEYIKRTYKYAHILHYKDIKEDTGEIKKEHIHCVVNIGTNPRSIKAVAKELEIEEQYIEGCNKEAQIRYLIHKDNKEKAQYKEEEIITNMKEDVEKALKDKETEIEKVNRIIEYIEKEKPRTMKQLILWAIQNGTYKEIRKAQYIFMRIINE